MTRINLLPWRLERRKELQRQFISIAGMVAVMAGVCVYGVYAYFDSSVDDQMYRNKKIQERIAELESKITEIRELQKRRDQIVESMKVIQDLQGNRPVIVHSLGALVQTIPDGVYYTKIERKGGSYQLYGVASTNSKISKLMRNLDESDWFKDPVLIKVSGIGKAGSSSGDDGSEEEKSNKFELTVMEDTPNKDDGVADS